MDLEARLAQAHEELQNAGTAAEGSSKRVNREWIPSSTPKVTLTGHRDKINAISFHPQYSVLASASVDATVKIWDWETGECERTLKSHTKSVSDCQFDSTGKVLGELSICCHYCSHLRIHERQQLAQMIYSSNYGMSQTTTRTSLL